MLFAPRSAAKTLIILLLIAAVASLALGYWAAGVCLLAGAGIAALWHAERVRTERSVRAFVQAIHQVRGGTFNSYTVPRQLNLPWTELSAALRSMGNQLVRREEKLLKKSASLKAVLASMTEGVLAIDVEGHLILANQSACQMLSIVQPEVIGRPLINHIRIPELMSAIETAQRDPIRVECEFQTLHEPRRTISARLTSIHSDDVGSSIAIVLHDVTNIRQLENMRRDFVANVSHELKTPLSVIKAYAETLRMGAINDQLRNVEFVTLIESQASLLERQIQDLIQLARIESQNANFEITEVDLNELCRDCLGQLSSVANKQEISLRRELSDAVLMAKGDSEAFRAILKNLIANALQFTLAGGQVTVRSWADHQTIQVEIVDTGIGMTAEQQTRIFERFYRADKARSREMGGTGLGLAIVKHLTTSLGGTVTVQSEIGKGSTFRVTFPKAQR